MLLKVPRGWGERDVVGMKKKRERTDRKNQRHEVPPLMVYAEFEARPVHLHLGCAQNSRAAERESTRNEAGASSSDSDRTACSSGEVRFHLSARRGITTILDAIHSTSCIFSHGTGSLGNFDCDPLHGLSESD